MCVVWSWKLLEGREGKGARQGDRRLRGGYRHELGHMHCTSVPSLDSSLTTRRICCQRADTPQTPLEHLHAADSGGRGAGGVSCEQKKLERFAQQTFDYRDTKRHQMSQLQATATSYQATWSESLLENNTGHPTPQETTILTTKTHCR